MEMRQNPYVTIKRIKMVGVHDLWYLFELDGTVPFGLFRCIYYFLKYLWAT